MPGHTRLKLEVRKNGLTGDQLLDPGNILNVEAEVAVNAAGEVATSCRRPVEPLCFVLEQLSCNQLTP